jgi:hypothetical protein
MIPGLDLSVLQNLLQLTHKALFSGGGHPVDSDAARHGSESSLARTSLNGT